MSAIDFVKDKIDEDETSISDNEEEIEVVSSMTLNRDTGEWVVDFIPNSPVIRVGLTNQTFSATPDTPLAHRTRRNY